MNVITGVLFAAIAYGFGVNYTPAIVGGVTPGGPAWEAGIEPGGRVVAIGEYESEEMHFREMRKEIVTAGLKNPDQPIAVRIQYDDEVREYDLVTAPHPADNDLRMIGIQMPISTELSTGSPANSFFVASDVLKDADTGGKIVSFDGTPVQYDSLVPGTPMFDYIFSNPAKTIKLELEREDGSKHTVEMPPQKSKTIGLTFGIGPIQAIAKNSPAMKAGLKKGDEIVAVDDQEVADAFGLPVALAMAGDSVTLKVRRKNGDDVEIVEVNLEKSTSPQTVNPLTGTAGEIASNSFGFSCRPTTAITGVNASSEDSDQDRLQAGDIIKQVHLVTSDELEETANEIDNALEKAVFKNVLEQLSDYKFEETVATTNLNEMIQVLPLGTELVVLAERPPTNKVIKTTLTVTQGEQYSFERGFTFVGAQETETAQSFPHALSLGVREGKRRFGDVVEFLGMLVRGKIKAKLIGGPIKIAEIAAQEAERGVPALLLFLTMLSMNLAILNFLPIPALDGGHMVFLIAEAIRGKRVNEELEMRLTLAGVIALLALMGFVFFNDIFGI